MRKLMRSKICYLPGAVLEQGQLFHPEDYVLSRQKIIIYGDEEIWRERGFLAVSEEALETELADRQKKFQRCTVFMQKGRKLEGSYGRRCHILWLAEDASTSCEVLQELFYAYERYIKRVLWIDKLLFFTGMLLALLYMLFGRFMIGSAIFVFFSCIIFLHTPFRLQVLIDIFIGN